jgi:hypothetical protein
MENAYLGPSSSIYIKINYVKTRDIKKETRLKTTWEFKYLPYFGLLF